MPTHFRPARPALALLALCLGGCSIISPEPVWELAKATASVASLAIGNSPSRSSDTIRHFQGGVEEVCIRYNPDAQVPDIVPALQAELRLHKVESRVYDSTMPAETCAIWLRYMAQIDWGTPPFEHEYRAFVSQAALSLRTANGQVLSTSHYQSDAGVAKGRWTSTREKLSPVVTALLTGVDNQNPMPNASNHR